MFRIGTGFDVHRFDSNVSESGQRTHIVLAGVEIPHTHSLLAHSDGDVLVHALCDALLGALALGDIGQHFPDTDPQYRGISSLSLLEKVYRLVVEAGWCLQNADITVIAEAPKLAPFQMRMRQSLAATLQVLPDSISIKATTSEGLGFTGRGEGIAVQAQVLIREHKA